MFHKIFGKQKRSLKPTLWGKLFFNLQSPAAYFVKKIKKLVKRAKIIQLNGVKFSYWKVMPKLELFLIGCLMAIGLFVGLDRTSDVTVSDVKNSYQAAKIRVKEIVPKKSDE